MRAQMSLFHEGSRQPHDLPLCIDLFAGGGGASLGIEAGFRPVDIAVNHSPTAIALHSRNHPEADHYCEDIWSVDPLQATQGRSVDILWASPDCRHFSRAKGGKPTSKSVRSLADVVPRWAAAAKPAVILLENVPEFLTWGPVDDDGYPVKERAGEDFARWKRALENLGYAVEYRMLRACDFGTPTTRTRLFIVARRDGQPIVWPAPTHGPGLRPYRTAAECIDWSIPAPSIFTRRRPLSDATLRRVAAGLERFVFNDASPYIVRSAGGLVAPCMIQTSYGERKGQAPRVLNLHKPLGTAVAGGQKHALVCAFLAKHYTGVVGHKPDRPLGTITAVDHHSLVTAFLIKYYGAGGTCSVSRPLDTITTKDRFGLVMIEGEEHQVVDIGLRMLTPRELARAQGFPDTYALETTCQGDPLTIADQVRMVGNSVCPQVAEALVRANSPYPVQSKPLAA